MSTKTITIGSKMNWKRSIGLTEVTVTAINDSETYADVTTDEGYDYEADVDDLFPLDAEVKEDAPAPRTLNELIYLITNGLSRNGHDFTHSEARDVLAAVELEGDDFAKIVAKTVASFGRASSKQAYIVAKAYMNI